MFLRSPLWMGQRHAKGVRRSEATYILPLDPKSSPSAFTLVPILAMLILASDSTCDVCRDRYNCSDINPHVLVCGHSFCLGCLEKWNRSCPLCRVRYTEGDARKIIIHSIVPALVPSTPARHVSNDMDDVDASPPDDEEEDNSDEIAKDLLAQITDVTLGGDRPSQEVHDLVAAVKGWLLEQPEDQYLDLRSAQILLWKVMKRREDKSKYSELQARHDDLMSEYEAVRVSHDTLQSAKDKLYRKCEEFKTALATLQIQFEELREKRVEEKARALDVEMEWKERLEQVDLDWRGKYERCLKDNETYRQRLQEIRPDLVRSPSKEVRNIYSGMPTAEPMSMADEERPSGSPPRNRQSIFQLSPVPATLPIPSIASVHATFHSPADDSDAEEVRRVSNYANRAVQPIPIKSNGHYRHGSLLYRNDSDSVARSIPRSLVDVQMASCSSSPAVNDMKYSSVERQYEAVSQSITMHDSSPLSRRSTVSSRRPSVSHPPQDVEGQRLMWKAQLKDLLDQEPSDNEAPRTQPTQSERRSPPRTTSPPRPSAVPRRTTSPETRRSISPESSAPVTRQPSPVSNTSAFDPAAEKERMQSMLLQRPKEVISRASTAAMQVEQARERARLEKEKLNHTSAPPPSQPVAPMYKDTGLQRDISTTYHLQQQQQQYPRPAFQRRSSDAVRGKPLTSQPANPSGLTRSLWTSDQHAQRV